MTAPFPEGSMQSRSGNSALENPSTLHPQMQRCAPGMHTALALKIFWISLKWVIKFFAYDLRLKNYAMSSYRSSMTESISTLEHRLDSDLKQAMRDRNDVAKLALRAVKTALTEARKSGADHSLTDEQIQLLIQREVKRRRDAAAEYEKLGAPDKALAEQAEVAVLEKYLPEQLDEAAVESIVRTVIAEIGATSMSEMGKVMSATMPRVQGVADGKMVNQIVRRLLAGA
ncbi:MAG: GatB/YqeY domain-containing protein [Caldilineaceae bacterium]